MELPNFLTPHLETVDQSKAALLAISAALAVALGLAMADSNEDADKVEQVSSALQSGR